MITFVSRFRIQIVFALGLLLGVGGMGIAWSAEQQPHMQSALTSLQSAQAELQAATGDKGGHRANALNYVAKAIQETQWGIEYAAGH